MIFRMATHLTGNTMVTTVPRSRPTLRQQRPQRQPQLLHLFLTPSTNGRILELVKVWSNTGGTPWETVSGITVAVTTMAGLQPQFQVGSG